MKLIIPKFETMPVNLNTNKIKVGNLYKVGEGFWYVTFNGVQAFETIERDDIFLLLEVEEISPQCSKIKMLNNGKIVYRESIHTNSINELKLVECE